MAKESRRRLAVCAASVAEAAEVRSRRRHRRRCWQRPTNGCLAGTRRTRRTSWRQAGTAGCIVGTGRRVDCHTRRSGSRRRHSAACTACTSGRLHRRRHGCYCCRCFLWEVRGGEMVLLVVAVVVAAAAAVAQTQASFESARAQEASR
jgi:hypothetical protein